MLFLFRQEIKNKARLDKHWVIITISMNNQRHGNIVGLIGLKPFLWRETLFLGKRGKLPTLKMNRIGKKWHLAIWHGDNKLIDRKMAAKSSTCFVNSLHLPCLHLKCFIILLFHYLLSPES